MQKMLTRKAALSLVSRYCRAAETELTKEEKERIAKYLQLQSRNRSSRQTTLVSEDAAVMEQLARLIEDNS